KKGVGGPVGVRKWGEGAMKTIAEQVDAEAHHCRSESHRVKFCKEVAHTRQNHPQKTDQRQMVRVDPFGHSASEAEKNFLFERRQQAFLLARRRSEIIYQRLFRAARLVKAFLTIRRASVTGNGRPANALPLQAWFAFSGSEL